MNAKDRMIRIGTLVKGDADPVGTIGKLGALGFESYQLTFWQTLGETDLSRLAGQLAPILEAQDTVISSLSVFGNPLGEGAIHVATREAIRQAILQAPAFGARLVTGFTGRVPGCPVPDSIAPLKSFWSEMLELADSVNVTIAFENCPMGGTWHSGDWNIAFSPDTWELIFEALPASNVGLEWEPCHALCQLIDPIAQLRQWMHKVVHVHGKDATVFRDQVQSRGIGGKSPFAYHRHPGFGDSNWTDIISILRMHGYASTIDIEGWHDPVYKGELEMTGQVAALEYLKRCRGGSFVPN